MRRLSAARRNYYPRAHIRRVVWVTRVQLEIAKKLGVPIEEYAKHVPVRRKIKEYR